MNEEPKQEKKPKTRKPRRVKYIGIVTFIAGLPARDMDFREWNTYPKNLRDKGLGLGLYKME